MSVAGPQFRHVESSGHVAISLACDTGSIQESIGERGLAHVVEHMCFKNTACIREGWIGKTTKERGAFINAYTSYDTVAAYISCEAGDAEFFTYVLFNIMFSAEFNDVHLAREMLTIYDEMNRRESSVSSLVWKFVKPLAGVCSGTGLHDPIGNIEDLDALTADKLQRFYERTFVPQRSVLVIVAPKGDYSRIASAWDRWQCKPRRFTTPLPLQVEGSRKLIMRLKESCACNQTHNVKHVAQMPDVTIKHLVMAWCTNVDVDPIKIESANILLKTFALKSVQKHLGLFGADLSCEVVVPGRVVVLFNLTPPSSLSTDTNAIYERLKRFVDDRGLVHSLLVSLEHEWAHVRTQWLHDMRHDAVSSANFWSRRLLDEKEFGLTPLKDLELDSWSEILEIANLVLDTIRNSAVKMIEIDPCDPSTYAAVSKQYERYVQRWRENRPVEGVHSDKSGVCECLKNRQLPSVEIPASAFDSEDVTCVITSIRNASWNHPDCEKFEILFSLMNHIHPDNTTELLLSGLTLTSRPQGRLCLRILKQSCYNTATALAFVKNRLKSLTCGPDDFARWKAAVAPILLEAMSTDDARCMETLKQAVWGLKPGLKSWMESLTAETVMKLWQQFVAQLGTHNPQNPPIPTKTPHNAVHTFEGRNPTNCTVVMAFRVLADGRPCTLDSETTVHDLLCYQESIGGGFGSALYDLREKEGLFYSLNANIFTGVESVYPKDSHVIMLVKLSCNPQHAWTCVKRIEETIHTAKQTVGQRDAVLGIANVMRNEVGKNIAIHNALRGGWDQSRLLQKPAFSQQKLTAQTLCTVLSTTVQPHIEQHTNEQCAIQ